MEMLEMNITCSLLFLLAEILECFNGDGVGFSWLEMKKRMMEFSFRKMGIENRITRVEN